MSEPKAVQTKARAKTGGRLFWLSFAVAVIAALFGWSAAEDAANLRTCELAIGALNDADAQIDIQRTTAVSFSRIIRVDYRVAQAGSHQSLNRFVSCRFGARQNGSNLASVETESGPLPDSQLYLMRRFFLDTADARNAGIPFTGGNASGPVKAGAVALEWFFSVLSKGAVYGVLAGLYLWFSSLFNQTTRYQTLYSSLAGFLTMAGAAATSPVAIIIAVMGVVSPFSLFLVLIAGMVGLVTFRLVVEEEARLAAGRRDIVIFSWLLLSGLIGLALFWFPTHGPMHLFWWSPGWLTRTVPLFTLGGHNVSTTPVAALTIMAALCFLVIGSARSNRSTPRNMPAALRHLGLIAIPVLAGMTIASGFMQFGLTLNPLLLGTKAALIALLCLALRSQDRYRALLPVSLIVVTLEYALMPFLTTMATNAASYAALVLALYILLIRRSSFPGRS